MPYCKDSCSRVGAFFAKQFSGTKNFSDSNAKTTWKFDNDDGVVKTKMVTRMNKISKSFLDKNENYVSSDLNKFVRGSVCVRVQLVPPQAIEDKKHRRKDKQNRRLFVTRRFKRKIGRNKLPPNLYKKKAQVDLKRLKLPLSFCKEIISNKSSSNVRLQATPKTLKERKNSEKVLRQFNKDHSDDMFDYLQIPNHLSQMNLGDTSSSSSSEDEDASSDDQPGTSIINSLPQFSGWSAQTPDPARDESEDDENEVFKGQLDEFVNKTIVNRRHPSLISEGWREKLKSSTMVHTGIDKLGNSTKDFMHALDNGGCSAPKSRKPHSLKDFLSDLNPALEKLNKSQRDLAVDDDIEIEPYFDEDT